MVMIWKPYFNHSHHVQSRDIVCFWLAQLWNRMRAGFLQPKCILHQVPQIEIIIGFSNSAIKVLFFAFTLLSMFIKRKNTNCWPTYRNLKTLQKPFNLSGTISEPYLALINNINSLVPEWKKWILMNIHFYLMVLEGKPL